MNFRPTILKRAVAGALVWTQVFLSIPLAAAGEKASSKPADPPPVKVNRTVPKLVPVAPLAFSKNPADVEFLRLHVFDEALVPMGGKTSTEENRALAGALTAYKATASPEAVQPVVDFLAAHPKTPWRAALLTNLGLVYRQTGYFSKALTTWEEAWTLSKNETSPNAKAIGDRAVAELAAMNARLGRFDRLQALLDEIEGRDVTGPANERLRGAREGFASMKERPEVSFRCGPLAVDRILAHTNTSYPRDVIAKAQSTMKGTSLVQVRDLAQSAGLAMQIAKRSGDADPLVPAVVHWKAGHFAALVEERDGRYLMQDPTFGDETWLTRAALNEESDGYFLVPDGKLPAGWSGVSDTEGAEIWGKGQTNTRNPNNQNNAPGSPGNPPVSAPNAGCSKGMATYTVNLMLVNLVVSDRPVGYSPPVGPSVDFSIHYNLREQFQPSIPYYSNFGPKWTHTWLSWVEDNPSNPSASANVYRRGGGFETFSGFTSTTNSYAADFRSRAVLVRTSTNPIRYERRRADGWVEVFAQSDGGTVPRRVFLTQEIDAQGNALSISYDPSAPRILAITDALNQVTTFSYDSSDPLKVTQIKDPFGRFAQFEYDAQGNLSAITDVIGMRSEFQYGNNTQIIALTTPYGTTKFAHHANGNNASIEVTDPLGGRQRMEYIAIAPVPATESAAPAGFATNNTSLEYRNAYYWDQRAIAYYPDYTKARVFHFLHDSANQGATSDILESEKKPLESRVYYAYPGQPFAIVAGTSTQPIKVARLLDDGSTQLYQYSYGAHGEKTQEIDPMGRETDYVYDTNGLDLLTIKQKNPASSGGFDVLQQNTYNGQHEILTSKDAAGQTTTYEYNAQGQILTVTTPPRAGITENRTSRYTYNPDGTLDHVTGPLPAATSSSTYDAYGRLKTSTDADNYTLIYDYDALDRQTRVTYPDGTYEETMYNKLDAQDHRDRLGRTSHTFHDALRRPIARVDTLGHTTTQQWCSCGSLDKVVDGNGNATSWVRDVQGRVTQETRADGAATTYVYENRTSRQKSVTDPKNQTKTLSYAKDNNLLNVTYTNAQVPTANVSFTYDTAYNRGLTMVDGIGTTTYGYVSTGALGAGNLASVTGPLPSSAITYTYDELGRVINRNVNGNANSVGYAYDSLGRLSTETNLLGTFTWSYDGATGRMLSLAYPNGQTSTYTYFDNSNEHRLQTIWHKAPDSSTLSKFDYAYDRAGNILTWSQQPGSNPAKVWNLAYDATDRLTAATITGLNPAPVPSRYAWAYDKAGNRTAEQQDDAVTAATYNNRNELVSQHSGGALLFKGSVSEPAAVNIAGTNATVATNGQFEAPVPVPSGTNNVTVTASDYSGNTRTNTYQISQSAASTAFTYDANGNMTSDGAMTYTWDAENRLVSVSQGGSTVSSYAYNAAGLRASKTVGGITTTFVFEGGSVIEARQGIGQVIRTFYGQGIDNVVGEQDSDGTVKYFTVDHLGSIRDETNAAGQATLSREYDLWGNPLLGASIGGPAFTGREWDPETALYYYRARYYEPRAAIFLSHDPAEQDLAYGYGGMNPMGNVDPSGLAHVSWDCTVTLSYKGFIAMGYTMKAKCTSVCTIRVRKKKCVEIEGKGWGGGSSPIPTKNFGAGSTTSSYDMIDEDADGPRPDADAFRQGPWLFVGGGFAAGRVGYSGTLLAAIGRVHITSTSRGTQKGWDLPNIGIARGTNQTVVTKCESDCGSDEGY